jgi:hypothetical protein
MQSVKKKSILLFSVCKKRSSHCDLEKLYHQRFGEREKKDKPIG